MYVQVKVAVIYHGETEQVYRLALAATEGAWDAGGEVRVRRAGPFVPPADAPERPEWPELFHDAMSIPEASAADLAWADVALFGTGAHDGVVVDRLRQYIDSTMPLWRSGRLAEKVYGAFTGAAPAHGGASSRLVTLLDVFQQWGGIVVSLGPRDHAARPGVHATGTARQPTFAAPPERELAAARRQGMRATETARALMAGRRVLADVA